MQLGHHEPPEQLQCTLAHILQHDDGAGGKAQDQPQVSNLIEN